MDERYYNDYCTVIVGGQVDVMTFGNPAKAPEDLKKLFKREKYLRTTYPDKAVYAARVIQLLPETARVVVMKEFKKNDWYGYAGCEVGPKNEQPLIGEVMLNGWCGACVIVDRNGIGIDYYIDSDATDPRSFVQGTWIYNCNYYLAKAIAEGLPYNLNVDYLRQLGFELEGTSDGVSEFPAKEDEYGLRKDQLQDQEGPEGSG